MSPPEHARVIKSDFWSACEKTAASLYLIVLNYTLPKATASLWHRARFRICADGGANRLYDELPLIISHDQPEKVRRGHLPDLIKGDMDSVRKDVAQFYMEMGVPIVDLSSDQDTTDLTKCILFLEKRIRANGQEEGHQILVLGALGGRLDHTLSNLNALYMFPQLNMTMWGDGNLVRLLRTGRNVIHPDLSREGPTCGLVPLGGRATASSQGLRWDLNQTSMSISGLISTSNEIVAQEVVVDTDQPLLWMTVLREDAGAGPGGIESAARAIRGQDPAAANMIGSGVNRNGVLTHSKMSNKSNL